MTHTTQIKVRMGRYPYRAECDCGWRGARGYIVAHAAQYDADDHKKRVDHAATP